MRTALLLLALIVAGSAFAQQKSGGVWKWVDKDGITHYSDQPGPPGSVKVDLRIQTYTPENSAPGQPAQRATVATAIPYQSIGISSPEPESTFRESTLNVSASVQPALQAGHKIRFEVDGQTQGESSRSSASLKEVPRGEHTVRASVVDAEGTVLIQSAPVKFFVQLPSLLSPTRKQ
jgi:hypothetical protein